MMGFPRFHLVLGLVFGFGSLAQAQQLYSNDFQTASGIEWSDGRLETSAFGTETFLGRFDGTSGFESTLSLAAIPTHGELLIDFDLFILQGWEGDGPSGWGPDSFLVEVDGLTAFDHTFISLGGGWTQSYPVPGSAPGAGAYSFNVDGISGSFYHISLIVPHTSAAAAVRFLGDSNPAPGDEAWGLDNIVVTAAIGTNLPPTAVNDSGYQVMQGFLLDSTVLAGADSVLTNDTDPEGDLLNAVLDFAPTSGNVVLNLDGTFQYTPFPGFLGSDSFTYLADDGQSLSAPGTVSLEVTALPTGPALYAAYSTTIDWLFDYTADLHTVDLATGALTLIGPLVDGSFPLDSIEYPMGMCFGADGTLYITNNIAPSLHTVDPTTGLKEYVNNFTPGVFLYTYEGSLAIAEDGTAYVSNIDGQDLWTVDLETGLGSYFGSLVPGHDLSGMTIRNDGKIVAMDGVTNWLIVVDPATMGVTPLAPLTPVGGSVSGMTSIDDVGYFATGNTVGGWSTGPNELWRFDLYTGAQQLVGPMHGGAVGEGVAGLAGKDSGLVLEPPSPGQAGVANSFAIRDAVPGSSVVLSFSLTTGFSAVGGSCPGQFQALGSANALLNLVPDNAGMANQSLTVPTGASGRTVYFQAMDPANCLVSNQVVTTF